MNEFVFALAQAKDDGAIQRLLRENPVPGRVTVGYERSPSYFHGCDLMGGCHQTLVARHLPSGELAGVATRALCRMFVNGEPREVGYLGQLRVDHRFRSRWLVSGGFRVLRELDRNGRAEGYLTTIIEGNREAEGVLVHSARRHFPVYRPLERLHTLALTVRPAAAPERGGCEVLRGDQVDLEEIIAFLRRHGAGKQFFPEYSAADFLPGAARSRGFAREDFRVACKGGRIVGVTGLWDQSGFKQSVVRGYSGGLAWGRPLFNLYARCRGTGPLPPPGEELAMAYAAFTCIAGDDRQTYRQLLSHLLHEAARRRLSWLMVGASERDPLLAVARRHPHQAYHSRLYTAGWENGRAFHERLDDRISHVEIAAL